MKWYATFFSVTPASAGWSTTSIVMPPDAVAAIVSAGSTDIVPFGLRASSADTGAFATKALLTPSAYWPFFFVPISSAGTFDIYRHSSGSLSVALLGYVTNDEAEAYDPMPEVSVPSSAGYQTLNWSAYAPGASAIGANLCMSTVTSFDFRHPGDASEHKTNAAYSTGLLSPCNDRQQISYYGSNSYVAYIAFGFKSGKTRAVIPRDSLVINNTDFELLETTNDFGWGGRIVGSGTTTEFALNDLKQDPYNRKVYSTYAVPHVFPIPHFQVGGYATTAPVTFLRDLALVGIHDADLFDWRPSGVGYAKQTVLNFGAADSYTVTTRGTSNRMICAATQAKIDSFNMEGDVDFNYYGTKVTINPLREISVPLSSAGQDISFSSAQSGLLIVTLYSDPRDIRARE